MDIHLQYVGFSGWRGGDGGMLVLGWMVLSLKELKSWTVEERESETRETCNLNGVKPSF